MLFRELFKNITIYSLGIFYAIVGVKHFTYMDFFLVIVPPYIPFPEFMVYVSGVFEYVQGFRYLFGDFKEQLGVYKVNSK